MVMNCRLGFSSSLFSSALLSSWCLLGVSGIVDYDRASLRSRKDPLYDKLLGGISFFNLRVARRVPTRVLYISRFLQSGHKGISPEG